MNDIVSNKRPIKTLSEQMKTLLTELETVLDMLEDYHHPELERVLRMARRELLISIGAETRQGR